MSNPFLILVEAVGIEPTSEVKSLGGSPSAVCARGQTLHCTDKVSCLEPLKVPKVSGLETLG